MSITKSNIFRRSHIYNCSDCIYDSRVGYYVDWPTNNDLNGYDAYTGMTSVTVWDGVYFAVASASECYFSSSSDISIEASKYDIVKLYMAVSPGTRSNYTATGKIQFKLSGDGSWDSSKYSTFTVQVDGDYHVYTVRMASSYKWSGTVTNLRIYPFIDGYEGSTIHVRSLRVESSSHYNCMSRFTGSICDSAYRYEHPCPWIGSPGKSTSSVLPDTVTIVEGTSDTLIINIDGYGGQEIKIRPGQNRSIFDVAVDIQQKLNLVGIGGFYDARCYTTYDNRLCVESGWRGTSSSVIVSQPSSGSAAVVLGFYDSDGTKIATEEVGTEPASRYSPAPVRASYAITSAFISPDTPSVLIPTGYYFPEGGRRDYANVVRDEKLSFRNKTLIDVNNPINSNGTIGFIAYSGDAFSNTEFRIYRQKLDGTIELVHSADMSVSTDTEDQVFTKDVNWRVKRGDLLALYSASLHLGASQERPSYSYFLYDGDLSTSSNMVLYGRGEVGLPLYARSANKATSMSIAIDFADASLIESVTLDVDNFGVEELVNLCTVRNGGLDGGPHVSGYTEAGDNGAPSGNMVNLDALIDGEKADINGTSPTCYPFWEPYSSTDKEDYTYSGFHIDFDFAYGVNAVFPIKYIRSYFDSKTNVKTFKWEVPQVWSSSGPIREWGVGWGSYDDITTDLGQLDSASYLYDNPSVVTVSGYQISYVHTKYRQLFHTLEEPVQARGLRYNVTLDGTNTTDEYKDNYAKFPPAPGPKIEEIEIYAAYYPNFSADSYISIESSDDGDSYVTHDDIDTISSSEVRFTIGRPTKKLKCTFDSEFPILFSSATAEFSEGRMSIDGLEDGERVGLAPSTSTPEQSVSTITVTNDSSDTSTFFIDILKEGSLPSDCILWNEFNSDDAIKKSRIGPGGVLHKRSSFSLRPTNYAYKCDGYVLYKNIDGNSIAYISTDSMSSWTNIGTILSDRSTSTYITNETEEFHAHPYVYVAFDLGRHLDISEVSLYSGSYDSFDSAILYSSMDTSNPADIPYGGMSSDRWKADSISNARWCLFRAPSIKPNTTGVKYLYYVDIDLNIRSDINKNKSIWTYVGDKLTNGSSAEGWITSGEASYCCVDLGWWLDITNVIVGPSAYTGDVNSIEAGDSYSLVDSSLKGDRVAYGYTNTSDPDKVEWSSFNTAPTRDVRWVLIACEDSSYVDEIIIHADFTEESREVSYLNSKWCSGDNVTLRSDFIDTRSGLCAVEAAVGSTTTSGVFTITQDFGIDTECAPRDSLSFWFYVSDVSVLTSDGHIRLGTSSSQTSTIQDIGLSPDTYNYYEWPMSTITGVIEDGWNYLSLPLSDNYRHGEPYFARGRYDAANRTSPRDRFTYLTVYVDKDSVDSQCTVKVDDLRILRRYYTEGNFGSSLYIPYSEYVRFVLGDFNPECGTISFYLKSDWVKSIFCNSCLDHRDHTILRVFSSIGNDLFFLYMTSYGLKFYVTDGNAELMLTDNSNEYIHADTPTHVALTWNFTTKYGAPSLGIYINGVLSSSIDYGNLYQYGVKEFDFVKQTVYSLIIGSMGWHGLMSYDASSVDGAIEDLRVYTKPITDFTSIMEGDGAEEPKSPDELIEISINGTDYYGIEDEGAGLPLVKTDVPPNASFNVYVRARGINSSRVKDALRTAHITVARTA